MQDKQTPRHNERDTAIDRKRERQREGHQAVDTRCVHLSWQIVLAIDVYLSRSYKIMGDRVASSASSAVSSRAGSQTRAKLNDNNSNGDSHLSHKSRRPEGMLGGGRRRTREGGRGGTGGRRREKNDTGKPPSNPKGWPDRSEDADLEERPRRTIVVNAEQESWFCSNFVRTSKVCDYRTCLRVIFKRCRRLWWGLLGVTFERRSRSLS